jgi:hypothetical protein
MEGMNGGDLSRLVSLARTDARFLRGGLGDEIVQRLETPEARELAKVLIALKLGQGSVPAERRRDIDAIMSLAGAQAAG